MKQAKQELSHVTTYLKETKLDATYWRMNILTYVAQHLSRLSFAKQLIQLQPDEQAYFQTIALRLFELLFRRLRATTHLAKHYEEVLRQNSADSDSDSDMDDEKTKSLALHFNVLAQSSQLALKSLNSLLSIPSLVSILQDLLLHPDPTITREALTLLSLKLTEYKERLLDQDLGSNRLITTVKGDRAKVLATSVPTHLGIGLDKNEEALLLLGLLDPLQKLFPKVTGATAKDELQKLGTDQAANQQAALLNVEMLASIFAGQVKYQGHFQSILETVISLIIPPTGPSTYLILGHWQHIATSAHLCLATLISQLSTEKILPHLPTFLPNTIAILRITLDPTPLVQMAQDIYAKKDTAATASKSDAAASKKKRKANEAEAQPSSSASTISANTLSLSPLLQVAALSVISSTVDSLPDFLSPYLGEVLRILLHPLFHPADAATTSTDSSSSSSSTSTTSAAIQAAAHLASTRQTITSTLQSMIDLIPPRQLLPSVFSHYQQAASEGYGSLRRLFRFLGQVCASFQSEAVKQHFKLVFKFFLAAAQQLRKNMTSSHTETKDGISLGEAEDSLVQSFLELTLKLNEVSFKGLFLKMLQWVGQPPSWTKQGGSNASANKSRSSIPEDEDEDDDDATQSKDESKTSTLNLVTTPLSVETQNWVSRSQVFFKLVLCLATKLKVMFVTYFGYLMEHSVAILAMQRLTHIYINKQKSSTSEDDDDDEEDSDSQASSKRLKSNSGAAKKATELDAVLMSHEDELVDLVMRSLEQCFIHDAQHFLDKHHFQLLTKPMVDQLGMAYLSRSSEFDTFVTNVYRPSMLALAARLGGDLLWKPLVSGLMEHGRHPSAPVRQASCFILEHIFKHIGESFLVVLPELLPWISELLEDGEPKVERAVQKLVKIIEDLSGESLDAALHGQ